MVNTNIKTPRGQFAKNAPELGRVREGYVLHYPRHSSLGAPQKRGGPGYIVRLDDPLANTEMLDRETCLRHGLNPADNQHHKLEPAPDGSVASTYSNEGAQRLYAEIGYRELTWGVDDKDGIVGGSPDDVASLSSLSRVDRASSRPTEVTVPKTDE